MQYNVVDHQPDKLGTRALTLVTKVIQASPWAGRPPTGRDATRIVARAARHFRGLLCVCALPARLGSARLGSVEAEPETTAALRTLVLFVCLLLCLCADRCRAAVLRRKTVQALLRAVNSVC